jgi:hypothetical protein
MKPLDWRPSLGSVAVLVAACAITAGGTVAASQHPPVEELKTRVVTIATAATGTGNKTALITSGSIRQQLRCARFPGNTDASILVKTSGQGAWLNGSGKLGTGFTFVAAAESSDGDGGATERSAYDVLLDDGTVQHYVADIGAKVLGVACWARVAVLSD